MNSPRKCGHVPNFSKKNDALTNKKMVWPFDLQDVGINLI